MPHLPAAGRPVPVSTYRVQLRPPADDHPGFGFDDAAAVVPYLADLGATHLYCSPYLQAAPGSTHGYDVVDHDVLNRELGGEEAFARMVAACRGAGLGIVLDVVPNHVAVSEPESQNAPWWSLLRDGRESPYADWFDVEWDSPDNPGKVLVPVLGAPLGEVVDELELLDDRVGTRATLITSQLPVSAWHQWLDDPTLADAILDRIVHSAHRIALKGESMRRKQLAS